MQKSIFRINRNFASFRNKLKRVQSKNLSKTNINDTVPEPTQGYGRRAVQCYNKKYEEFGEEGKNYNEIIRYDENNKAIYRHQPPHKSLDPINTEKYFQQSKPGEPLDFYIYGNENQVAVINLKPNQSVKSESGKILYKTNGVDLETSVIDKTGYKGVFNRLLTGQSFFQVRYEYKEQVGFGRVAFSPPIPSKILPIRLQDHDQQIICTKGSYLCGNVGTETEMHFQKKMSTAFFGGEGFILQKIKNPDNDAKTILLKAGGAIIKRYLREGESIQASPGHLICMEQSVDFDLKYVANIKNIFGADSMFFAELTGPGYIYLQTMAFDDLVSEISSRIPSGSTNHYHNSSSKDKENEEENNEENKETNEENNETEQENSEQQEEKSDSSSSWFSWGSTESNDDNDDGGGSD